MTEEELVKGLVEYVTKVMMEPGDDQVELASHLIYLAVEAADEAMRHEFCETFDREIVLQSMMEILNDY